MKKHILILTPRFPYPVIGGDRLRIYFICKALSKYYDLTLLSLCETKDELEMSIPEDGVFLQVERVFLPKWRSYLNCILALPTRTPLQIAYYKCTAFRKKLNSFLPKYDMALAHLIRTGDYLKDSEIPKVLEMTDAISMNYQRVQEFSKTAGIKNLVYSIEQYRLKRYEKSIANQFDLSVLVSKVDKDYLFLQKSNVANKVIVCSNGVDLDVLPYNYLPDGKTLVFIGSLTTVQNLDAVQWFAEHVMPLLQNKGKFVFKVVGRINEDDRLRLARHANVEVVGDVDSIPDAVKGAFAGICSVRLGAGVQNKILEYMALGIPTITSSTGLEGLEAKKGKDVLVADTPGQYVQAILSLVEDSELSKNLAEAGRRYVQKAHCWEGQLQPFLNSVARILELRS